MVRHLIRLEPGADLTLLENGPAAARLNAVTEVEVGDDAAFHHVRAQGRDHERRAATALFARLGRAVAAEVVHPDRQRPADPQRVAWSR